MTTRKFVIGVILALAIAPVATAQLAATDEQQLLSFVKNFADTRNTHNGTAMAELYSTEGEWLSPGGGKVTGHAALASMWAGVTGHVDRTVQSLELQGPNIAVIRVRCDYDAASGSPGTHHEVLVLVKQRESWAIGIHQTLD